MSSSHIVVSCGSAICPIMPSTDSVVMKLSFGVKPSRFYMRSMFWIGANRKKEDATVMLTADTILWISRANDFSRAAAYLSSTTAPA